MENKLVGIDLDDITLEQAKKTVENIRNTEKRPVLLYQTKHGFHLEIIYRKPVSMEENIRVRKKYGDDPQRIEAGLKRYNTIGKKHDILFNIKKNFWRKRIWI